MSADEAMTSDKTRAKLSRALDDYVMAVQADPESVGLERMNAESVYVAALTAHEQAVAAEAVLAFAQSMPLFNDD